MSIFSSLHIFSSVSVTGKRGVGIPIILLHDAEGGTITVELKSGCIYRGTLDEAQDNMNMTMKECVKISPEGEESRIEIAYIRGSQINFVILPDSLQKAPFFNRIKMWRKFSGHAVYGANTAMIEALGGRGGGRGGRGGRGGPPMGGRGFGGRDSGRGGGPPAGMPPQGGPYGAPGGYAPAPGGYSAGPYGAPQGGYAPPPQQGGMYGAPPPNRGYGGPPPPYR